MFSFKIMSLIFQMNLKRNCELNFENLNEKIETTQIVRMIMESN